MALHHDKLRVINNDRSFDKDIRCIIRGDGLHWGLTLEKMKLLHEQLGKKLDKIANKA
jgi:hypothetical protein